MNDFLIPQGERGFGKKHFEIRYSPEKSTYQIKDLGDGTGTFVKVSPCVALKSGYIISFGEIHARVNMMMKEEKEGKR